MSVTIQDNFNTAAAKPIDNRYGPYNSDAAAASAIPQIYRYKGLTVGVLTSGVVEEYWWDNVLTGNPIKKSAVGNLTGVTQGTGIIVDNTNPQIPDISVDTAYVQVVSNLSTDVPTDGASDVKYPSVKAVKTYADGLITGLLNDRGNWPGGATSPGAYPSSGGSGVAGAIMKGDIWFVNVAGYLGTTYVAIGASVRALIDTPGQTSANWDIIDAGLGFTPENNANKVSTGANVNADPTSTVKYPSVKALVEYVANHSPTPTTPDLQAVTNAGYTTSNPIQASSIGFVDPTFSNYAVFYCETVGLGSRIRLDDSFASPRLSLDTAGTDLTVWANTGSTQAILDFASVSGTQTYTFPNSTGTVALESWVTSQGYLSSVPTLQQVTSSGNSITNNIELYNAAYIEVWQNTLNGTLSSALYEDGTVYSSNQYLLGNRGLSLNNVTIRTVNEVFTTARTIEIPNASGTIALTSNLTPYLTTATAASTYLTITNALATYVPFYGGTMSGSLTFPNAYGITFGSSTRLEDGAGGTLLFSNNSDGIFLNIEAGASNYITFPAADGTIALTSQLVITNGSGLSQNYLTKTGATAGVLMGSQVYDNGTNVGIGTSSPTRKLFVNGTIGTAANSGILSGGDLFADTGTLFLKNTVSPGSTSTDYDAISSGGNLVSSGYNGLYLKKQGSVGVAPFYTLLRFPNNTANITYTFADLGSSGGNVPAITTSNLSGATNYVPKIIDTTGEISKSQVYDNGTSVGINTSSPDPSAILELNSTTKGFLLPRIGTGSFPASPVKGLMVYADADIDTGRLEGVYVRDSTNVWRRLSWT